MHDRSQARINLADLRRLLRLVEIDHADLFSRKLETARLYRGGRFAVALCQGAALHYLDGVNGIKDFDVWSFYKAALERPFPYRRRGILDFGTSKFGVSAGYTQFVGRRVDHIGRSISDSDYSDPAAVLQRYLRTGGTESARQLSKKAVILLCPEERIGEVVWPAPFSYK